MSILMLDYSNGSSNPYVIETRHNLVPPCMMCGKFIPIKLDGGDYFRFFQRQAGYVQDIFPYLTPDQREVLVTGIHPECFPKEEET